MPSIKGAPKTIECSFDELSNYLLTHAETADKQSVPAWTPAYFSGPRRLMSMCEGVSAAPFDIDHGYAGDETIIPVDDLFSASDLLKADGIEHVIISSYSYMQPRKGARARFVIPLSAPVDPKRWAKCWTGIALKYFPSPFYKAGTYADTKCRDAVHAYFASSCPPGAPRLAVRIPGRTIDVEEIIRNAPSEIDLVAAQVEPCHVATSADLQDLERKWKRKKNAPWLFALRNLMKGQAIAAQGARNDTVAKLVFAILKDAPHVTNESLSSLFTPSVSAMGGEPSVDEIQEMCKRGRTYVVKRSSDEPTPDRPIVQTADAKVYLRRSGKYIGPIDRSTIWENIVQRFPDEVANNKIALVDSEGKKLPDSVIIERYGNLVLDVKFEIGRKEDVIEGDSLILGCANRVAEPRYVQEVDYFLQAFCPNEKVFEDLLTWLVIAKTEPVQTLAALQIIGLPNTGKSLFAHAVAKLWHDGPPTSAEEAFGQFNERLKDCPFIFADEGLPTMKQGQKSFSQAFRALVSRQSIDVEKKGMMPTTAKGAVRIIFAANDVETLTFHETFQGEDINAVAERLYRFNVDHLRIDHIAPRVNPDDPESSREWGSLPEKIVEGMLPHVMYLSYTRTIEKKGRFCVKGDPFEIRSDLQIRGGYRDPAMEWIVKWVFDPKKVEYGEKFASHVEIGKVLVASNDISGNWSTYIDKSSKVPSIRQIGLALRVISKDRVQKKTHEGAPRSRLFEINVDLMGKWCESSGHSTREELDEQLNLRAKEYAQKAKR